MKSAPWFLKPILPVYLLLLRLQLLFWMLRPLPQPGVPYRLRRLLL
jgi:hypothetical protein